MMIYADIFDLSELYLKQKRKRKKNTHKEHQYIQTQQFFYIKKSK